MEYTHVQPRPSHDTQERANGALRPFQPLTTPRKTKPRMQSQLPHSTSAARATEAKRKTWL